MSATSQALSTPARWFARRALIGLLILVLAVTFGALLLHAGIDQAEEKAQAGAEQQVLPK